MHHLLHLPSPHGNIRCQNLEAYMNIKDPGDIFDVIPHGRGFLKGLHILGGAVSCSYRYPLTSCHGCMAQLILLLEGDRHIRLELYPIWSFSLLPWLLACFDWRGRSRPRYPAHHRNYPDIRIPTWRLRAVRNGVQLEQCHRWPQFLCCRKGEWEFPRGR